MCPTRCQLGVRSSRGCFCFLPYRNPTVSIPLKTTRGVIEFGSAVGGLKGQKQRWRRKIWVWERTSWDPQTSQHRKSPWFADLCLCMCVRPSVRYKTRNIICYCNNIRNVKQLFAQGVMSICFPLRGGDRWNCTCSLSTGIQTEVAILIRHVKVQFFAPYMAGDA